MASVSGNLDPARNRRCLLCSDQPTRRKRASLVFQFSFALPADSKTAALFLISALCPLSPLLKPLVVRPRVRS